MNDVVLRAIDGNISDVIFVGEDKPWLFFVLALARMFIVLSLVVALIALTIETSRCVGAVLRANARFLQTFIDIRASFSVGQQLVALITVAIEARQSINAFMSALMNFHLRAFVDITVKWFIRFVSAIGNFVANEGIVDALSIVASELTGCASAVLLLAVNLVGVITAIIFTVYYNKISLAKRLKFE